MGAVSAEITPFEPARSCLKGKQYSNFTIFIALIVESDFFVAL